MDTVSLILIAVIVVAVVLLLQRLMNRNNYSQQGSNRPQYNDPNITSHGGFGGNQQQGNYQQGGFNHRQYDDPNIESHGGFGPSNGSSGGFRESERRSTIQNASEQRTVTREPESTRRNDDPNVSSHGGFGGQR
jgi:uncharacterized protein YgiB involved in biofilm formation